MNFCQIRKTVALPSRGARDPLAVPSDLHRKPLTTGGTRDRVLSLPLRKAKHRAAMRAFSVNVCFPISEAIAPVSEKSEKPIALPPPLRDVFGKDTEDPIKQYEKLKRPHDEISCRKIKCRKHHRGDPQSKIDPHKNETELIVSVSPVHKPLHYVFDLHKKPSHSFTVSLYMMA